MCLNDYIFFFLTWTFLEILSTSNDQTELPQFYFQFSGQYPETIHFSARPLSPYTRSNLVIDVQD